MTFRAKPREFAEAWSGQTRRTKWRFDTRRVGAKDTFAVKMGIIEMDSGQSR
jgi:hypothetical protein